MKYLVLASALLLAGCEIPDHPVATTDKVMAAQYRASTMRGVMTGAEATKISEAYQQGIAAPPAQQSNQAADMPRGQ